MPTTDPTMGDAQTVAPTPIDDASTALFHGSPDSSCSCSVANAAELHQLVTALAAEHGADLCGPGDEDESDEVMGLRLVHDLSLAHGAECDPGDEADDEDAGEEFDLHDEHAGFSDEDMDDIEDIGDEVDGDAFEVAEFTDEDEPTPITFSDDDEPPDPSLIHDLATFDLGPPIDEGDYVRYKDARIFRAGDYPRKNYSLPVETMAASVARVNRPIPLELEHINSSGTATFIDGEYGVLENPRVEGDWTIGDVVLDKWINRKWDKFLEKTGETVKQVSAVWNRATHDLERVGLVIKGHVEGAALNALFSDRDDDSAIDAMFAVDHEGEGDEGDDPVTFATPRKHHPRMTHAWQSIHDHAAMVPGICPANPVDPAMPVMMGDLTAQLKSLKKAHDDSVSHGATCSGSPAKMSDTEPRSETMPNASDIENDDLDPTEEEVNEFVTDSEPYKALLARLDAAEKAVQEKDAKFAEQAEAARVKDVKVAAAAFAKGEIEAGRSTSNEFDDLVVAFTDAADLDHKLAEVVTFSDADGKAASGSRVDRLKAREAKRPKHGLFSPALGDGDLLHNGERILFGDKPSDNPAEVRAAADKVLAQTNEGRAVLARRAK